MNIVEGIDILSPQGTVALIGELLSDGIPADVLVLGDRDGLRFVLERASEVHKPDVSTVDRMMWPRVTVYMSPDVYHATRGRTVDHVIFLSTGEVGHRLMMARNALRD